jgi:hypothetical protein
MSDRSFGGGPKRVDRGSSLRREVLGAVGALGLFASAEGCAANYHPTPATPDRYGLAALNLSDARQREFTQDQRDIWHHYFQLQAREAARISPEQRAALDRRVDAITARNTVQEAETTLDGTGIERAWQQAANADVYWSQYVRTSRHYDDESRQIEGMRWRAQDYQDWIALLHAFEEHSNAAHQIHITRESVDESLSLDGGPDTGTNNNADHTNVTDRFSEGAAHNFSSLLPSTSERLGFERREERVRSIGRGSNAEASRIRAMADFIGVMESKHIVLAERGSYFINGQTINRLSIARQSAAFYVRNVEFVTTQAENPDTGVLESQTIMTAEVLYNAPPAGHRLAENRVLNRPLFPNQPERP